MPRKNARGLQGNVPFKQPEYTKKNTTGPGKRKENDLLCFPSAAPTGNGKAHEDHFVSFALFCF